jgi:hypothetical protein
MRRNTDILKGRIRQAELFASKWEVRARKLNMRKATINDSGFVFIKADYFFRL